MTLAAQLATSLLLHGSNRELSHAHGEPGPPAPGFTMKMHDCDDEHKIATHLISNSVRESVGSAAASTSRDGRPGFRIFQYSLNGALYFFSELGAEACLLSLVIGDRLLKFSMRWGQKPDFHHGFTRPAASKASLAETVLISPRSNASIRSSASAAHRASMRSTGEASRLLSRRSASSARSAGGNDKASSRTCAPRLDMNDPPLKNCIISLQKRPGNGTNSSPVLRRLMKTPLPETLSPRKRAVFLRGNLPPTALCRPPTP